jgi:hypothetical protein
MKTIPLTQGKVAIVDDEDYESLSQFKWYAVKCAKTFYALRKKPLSQLRIAIRMHREIINPPVGFFCDHINGNGLDNRRSNLRIVTNAQNQLNKGVYKTTATGKKGVIIDHGKYRASIKMNRRSKHLGMFKTAEEASAAYQKAAKELFGEYARA